MTVKRHILPNLPYLLFLWAFAKLSEAYRTAPGQSLSGGTDVGAKILAAIDALGAVMGRPFTGLAAQDLLIGLAGAIIVYAALYIKSKNAKKWRRGIEYGSARWGRGNDIAPYIDPDFQKNMILTQTERLMMNSRPKSPKYARNKNVLVIGGSGSGKTRFFLKPNLMQMHSSYVITDPKGTVLVECGKMLLRGSPKISKDGRIVTRKGEIVYQPYRIKVLNTINFKKSMRYNPFQYLRSEKDILKLVTTIIANTKGEGEKSSEDFWGKAEKLYYTALIAFIWYEGPEDEKNFITLLEFINASEAREDDETFQNGVDILFAELENGNPETGVPAQPDHFAVKQYKKYKLAAGKTAKSILIGLAANEYVTDFKLEFGTVQPGFHETEAPYIMTRVLDGLPHEHRFVNKADAGGTVGDETVCNVDSWVTIAFGAERGALPRTGR